MTVYQSLYDLIVTYIYGAPEVLTSDMSLCATLCASAGAIFCLAIPFFVVLLCLKSIMNILG